LELCRNEEKRNLKAHNTCMYPNFLVDSSLKRSEKFFHTSIV
jgi:hypothetical protein